MNISNIAKAIYYNDQEVSNFLNWKEMNKNFEFDLEDLVLNSINKKKYTIKGMDNQLFVLISIKTQSRILVSQDILETFKKL